MHPGATFHPDDWRGTYFKGDRLAEIQEHLDPLRAFLTPETPTLASLALRFCLHHPAVSSVLPGMRKLSNVEANMTASDIRLLPETVAALRASAWRHGWVYPWCEGV